MSDLTGERKPLKLFDVATGWNEAPELPFARNDPENIITHDSLWRWMDTLKRVDKDGWIDRLGLRKYLPESPVLYREMLPYYQKLRFLSRANTVKGLELIAQDVKDSCNPETDLFYVEGFSSRMFVDHLQKTLPEFGSIDTASRSLGRISDRGNFQQDSPESAARWILVDDWVLTSTQLMSVRARIPDNVDVSTYHLGMSKRGQQLHTYYGTKGKALYRIEGEDGGNSAFGDYSVYGFHKVPDCMTGILADQARDHEPFYSIFPGEVYDMPGRHSRLAEL